MSMLWDRHRRALELLTELEDWQRLYDKATKLLCTDDAAVPPQKEPVVYNSLLNAAAHLMPPEGDSNASLLDKTYTTIKATLETESERKMNNGIERGPFIALVDFACRFQSTAHLTSAIVDYFKRFGGKHCCLQDLKPFLSAYGGLCQNNDDGTSPGNNECNQESIADLFKQLRAVVVSKNNDESGTGGPDDPKAFELSVETIEWYLSSVHISNDQCLDSATRWLSKCEMKCLPTTNSEMNCESLSGASGNDENEFVSRESYPKENISYYWLTLNALWQMFVNSGKYSILMEALAICEQALALKPTQHYFALARARIYAGALGVWSEGAALTDLVNLKYLQRDSLGYFVYQPLSALGHWSVQATWANEMLSRIYSSGTREITDNLTTAYRTGAFAQIVDFTTLLASFKLSLHRVAADVEEIFAALYVPHSPLATANSDKSAQNQPNAVPGLDMPEGLNASQPLLAISPVEASNVAREFADIALDPERLRINLPDLSIIMDKRDFKVLSGLSVLIEDDRSIDKNISQSFKESLDIIIFKQSFLHVLASLLDGFDNGKNKGSVACTDTAIMNGHPSGPAKEGSTQNGPAPGDENRCALSTVRNNLFQLVRHFESCRTSVSPSTSDQGLCETAGTDAGAAEQLSNKQQDCRSSFSGPLPSYFNLFLKGNYFPVLQHTLELVFEIMQRSVSEAPPKGSNTTKHPSSDDPEHPTDDMKDLRSGARAFQSLIRQMISCHQLDAQTISSNAHFPHLQLVHVSFCLQMVGCCIFALLATRKRFLLQRNQGSGKKKSKKTVSASNDDWASDLSIIAHWLRTVLGTIKRLADDLQIMAATGAASLSLDQTPVVVPNHLLDKFRPVIETKLRTGYTASITTVLDTTDYMAVLAQSLVLPQKS